MDAVLKIFLSMSFSGGLLILALLLGKRLLKNKISRQWQYYIWLIVILRLLLPFGLETNLLGKAYQAVDQAITKTVPLPQQQPPSDLSGKYSLAAAGSGQNNENGNSPAEDLATDLPSQNSKSFLVNYISLIWFVAAFGLMLRKITIYQGFVRYIKAGWTPVSDIEILDLLCVAAKQAGVKKPVELCVNPLVSSPLLIGFFHPCIVLPSADISGGNFSYIVLHELTHYRRRDMFYKWLVQFTRCLHWFNPLVHLMGREITKACEFSCDEAVLAKIGDENAQGYGKTLLDAMVAVGRYKENPGAVTLGENKQLLKERLGAIMSFKKKSKAMRYLTGMLTLCIFFGAAFIGVYPITASGRTADRPLASGDKNPAQGKEDTRGSRYSLMAERYYEAGSLPLFQMAFCHLDEEAQSEWLDRIYTDQRLEFFGAAVNLLDEDCAQIQRLAQSTYEADDITYFSVLAMHMSEDMLEGWLEEALEDGNWSFQSMLFDALDCGDQWDELEEKQAKEWEEAQIAEYGAAGVTMDGKNYYYRGELVNIFLDIRPNKSFYTMDMNPEGTVNIKMVRDKNNKITGVAYMTKAEVAELFDDEDEDDEDEDDWDEEDWDEDDWDEDDWDEEDWDEDDEEDRKETAGGRIWHPQIIPVNLETVPDGGVIWLGEYTLSQGDRIWYALSAETGNGMQVGFAKSGDKSLDTAYFSVQNIRKKNKDLKCIASFTVRSPGKSGTYQLFLRATDGDLGNVKGSISIGFAAE